MALPTMNMGDETAAPQMTDPTSKIKKKTRKDHCFQCYKIFTFLGLFLRNHRMTYLDIKVAVDLAGKRLEGGAAELVRATIPADVD
jgi:hypothetical protein